MRAFTRKLINDLIKIAASRLESPVVTYIVETRTWRLEQPYRYQHGEHLIRIPAGFEFDLASVPRAIWWLVAPFELSIAAPLLHDFLYRHGGKPPVGAITPPREYTREEADILFRDVMEEEGVPSWRRVPAYYAVRWFAAGGWPDNG